MAGDVEEEEMPARGRQPAIRIPTAYRDASALCMDAEQPATDLRRISLSPLGPELIVGLRCDSPSMLSPLSRWSSAGESPRVAFAPLPAPERARAHSISAAPVGIATRAAMLGPRRKLDAQQEAERRRVWSAGVAAFANAQYEELYTYDSDTLSIDSSGKTRRHRHPTRRRPSVQNRKHARARMPPRRDTGSRERHDDSSPALTEDEQDMTFLRQLKEASLDPTHRNAWEDEDT